MALLPADAVVLYLRQPGSDELTAVAAQGKYEEKLRGMTIRLGEGVAGAVATSQKPRVNVSAASDIARRFAPEEMVELSAATAVPLVHGSESLGVLAVYTTAYSVVNEHHLHLCNALAEHAAGAIQNAERSRREREKEWDPITGLANSRYLIRRLERLTRSAVPPESLGSPPFTVVMVDMEGFREVNETLGYLAGDQLLGHVGQTLSSLARNDDLVCRYAGDEFVLLMHGVSRDHVETVLDRVRAAIAALPAVEGGRSCASGVKVSANVGAATFPFDGLDARTLLTIADQRMYEEKFQRRM
jgi:diguanylate cyclase (GGDEF)-like protein